MPYDSAIHFFCNEIVSKITNFLQLYINLQLGLQSRQLSGHRRKTNAH